MNTIGRIFRVTIFGESHGERVGAVIDAPIAGLELTEADFDTDLSRRRAGQKGSTPRVEADTPFLASGTFNSKATGAPITVLFENNNTKSGDYSHLTIHPRPGHSDFVAQHKYNGCNDYRGGGHFSARVTLGVVAAGVIAKKYLAEHGITISSELHSVGGVEEKEQFEDIITTAQKAHDSVGAVVRCSATGLPIGLGEPFFDSVESLISHAVFSIPAVRGIEFGEGFAASTKRGSQHNDMIESLDGTTATNNAGGVNGGITNGNELVFKVAFKPTSSINHPQMTLNTSTGEIEELVVKGRHDACVGVRAPVIVEAMTAITIADLHMVSKSMIPRR